MENIRKDHSEAGDRVRWFWGALGGYAGPVSLLSHRISGIVELGMYIFFQFAWQASELSSPSPVPTIWNCSLGHGFLG